ncbi:hypothetical protein [Niallia sp. 01092]|uniref:hypothetical protein n=1 Tax=unclassified Niallia TaxID=2837522 RepID=UPI003FD0831D
MILPYIFLFITVLVMFFFKLHISLIIIVSILFFFFMLYLSLYPILFEKDEKKILQFLQKSKHPHYHFLFLLFHDEEEEARKQLDKIRYKQVKIVSEIILLAKQKKFHLVKELLPLMKETKAKWYYTAMISLKEGDLSNYETNKDRINDKVMLAWLEMEHKVKEGQKAEALEMLNKQIPTLKGLHLISALQYKKELTSTYKGS